MQKILSPQAKCLGRKDRSFVVPPRFARISRCRASAGAASQADLLDPGALTGAHVRAYFSLPRKMRHRGSLGGHSGAMFLAFPRFRLSARGRLSVPGTTQVLIPVIAFSCDLEFGDSIYPLHSSCQGWQFPASISRMTPGGRQPCSLRGRERERRA